MGAKDLDRVEFYFDGVYVGADYRAPFQASLDAFRFEEPPEYLHGKYQEE